MNRIDMHIHLGIIYDSKLSNTQLSATPAEVDQFIRESKLTHACVYFDTDTNIKELQDLSKEDYKIYAYQWLPNLKATISKEAIGLKLHSHRGYTNSILGKESCGIDYTSRDLSKLLKDLPLNWSFYFHTQGSTSVVNESRPLTIAKLALYNSTQRYICCHAGSFHNNRSTFPSPKREHTKSFVDNYYTACCSLQAIAEAVELSMYIPNFYLESSTIMPGMLSKVTILKRSEKWGLGSDYPFSRIYKEQAYSILSQEKLITKEKSSVLDIETIHQRSIDFLEKDFSQNVIIDKTAESVGE